MKGKVKAGRVASGGIDFAARSIGVDSLLVRDVARDFARGSDDTTLRGVRARMDNARCIRRALYVLSAE